MRLVSILFLGWISLFCAITFSAAAQAVPNCAEPYNFKTMDRLRAGTGSCSPTGEQRIAVILISTPNSPWPEEVPKERLQTLFFSSDQPSLKRYWEESSYGRATVSGDVMGIYTIGRDFSCGGDDGPLLDAALAAAEGQYDLSRYQRIFLVRPNLPGCARGGSSLGCGDIVSLSNKTYHASVSSIHIEADFSDSLLLYLMLHEGGHGLGLRHAPFVRYDAERLAAPGVTGALTEYGDPFSSMGSGDLMHYSAFEKFQLGWLTPGEISSVEDSATLELQPMAVAGPGTKALRIRRHAGVEGWLWLEYRRPDGDFESHLPAISRPGALIHYEHTFPHPLNMTISGAPAVDFSTEPDPQRAVPVGPLPAGAIWRDPYSPRTLRVGNVNANPSISVENESLCVNLANGSKEHGPLEYEGSLEVNAPASCAWTASTAAPWIKLHHQSGNGPGNISYTLQAYTGNGLRHGAIGVGRRSFLISQAPSNAAPQVADRTPSNRTGPIAKITVAYSDRNGIQDLDFLRVNLSGQPSLPNACAVELTPFRGPGRFAQDDGSWVELTAGISNRRCQYLGHSLFQDGEELRVEYYLAPSPSSQAKLDIYAQATDRDGADTGWQPIGGWNFEANQAPKALTVAPARAGGYQQTFLITLADANGHDDIAAATLSIGPDCRLRIRPAGMEINQLAARPSCEINPSDSRALPLNANEIHVRVAIRFHPGGEGAKPIHISTQDLLGRTEERAAGVWNVGAQAGPDPRIAAIVNGADFQAGPVSPGGLVTIFGEGLGPTELRAATYEGEFLPNVIEESKVFVDGRQASLIYTSARQLTALIPFATVHPARITVEYQGRVSAPVEAPLNEAAPAIFRHGDGTSRAVAINQDGTINSPANAGMRGQVITLFVTGQGIVHRTAEEGRFPAGPEHPAPRLPVLVSFSGHQGEILFSGLTYPGVLQINVRVPERAPIDANVPIRLSVGAHQAGAEATLALR